MDLKALRVEYNHAITMANLYLSVQNYGLAIQQLHLAIKRLTDLSARSSPEVKDLRISFLMTLSDFTKQIEVKAHNQPSLARIKRMASQSKGMNSEDECKFLLDDGDIPTLSFDDVVGLEDVKHNILMQVIYPQQYADLYKRFRKRTGGGVLLYGPPGNGKTMIAKAIAHETGAKFYLVRASELLSKWVGESERNLHDLFEHARQQSKAVIFIDEVEALVQRRSGESNAAYSILLSQLLTELQGFEEDKGNLTLIAATNKPWAIDPAFLRPGRFDEKIYVPLPDEIAREHLFRVKLADVPADDIDFAALAKMTPRFSGADVEYLCEKVKGLVIEALIAGKPRPERITMNDFLSTIGQMQCSVTLSEEQALEQWRMDNNVREDKRAI